MGSIPAKRPQIGQCDPARRGRPVTLSPEARREVIFAALEELHSEAGLDGATMQAIARHAGMSKRTLYDVFPSRTTLLRAYMDKVAEQFIQPLPETETAMPISERLTRLMSRNARHQGYGLPLEILRTFMAQVPACPDIGRDLVDRLMQRDLRILTEELDRGVARAEIALDDTGQAAALLLDMLRPWPLESLLDPARLASPEEFAARTRLAVRVFLNGVATG